MASALAEMAGKDFIATAPSLAVPNNIIRSCECTIFEAAGNLPSEPTKARFSGADPISEDEYLATEDCSED